MTSGSAMAGRSAAVFIVRFYRRRLRHPRESGDPAVTRRMGGIRARGRLYGWIPACAGMTSDTAKPLRPAGLAATHRADDLEAVAVGERRVGIAAARHDLPVQLDGDTLAGERQRVEQRGDAGWRVAERARLAIDAEVHCGKCTRVRRGSAASPRAGTRAAP